MHTGPAVDSLRRPVWPPERDITADKAVRVQGRSGEDNSPIHLADRTDGVNNCERERNNTRKRLNGRLLHVKI